MLAIIITMQRLIEASPIVGNGLGDKLIRWLMSHAVTVGTKIIVAVLIYIIGSSLISILRRFVRRLLIRKDIDPAVSSFVNSLTNTLLKVLLAIVIIGVLGIPTVSFAAILAAAGLAVGMAMKDNLSNFAGGVMILLNKPFHIGDRILAQSQDGVVKEIGILYTVLLTGDGRTVYIPNGPLSTGNIVNFSTENNRRVDLVFNISYGNNAQELIEIIRDVVNQNELVLKDPAVFVGVTTVNNGNFDITVRAWASNSNNSIVSVQLNEAVYGILTKKGIFISSCLNVRIADSRNN